MSYADVRTYGRTQWRGGYFMAGGPQYVMRPAPPPPPPPPPPRFLAFTCNTFRKQQINAIVFNSVRCCNNVMTSRPCLIKYWRPLVLRRPIILAPQGGGGLGPQAPPGHHATGRTYVRTYDGNYSIRLHITFTSLT